VVTGTLVLETPAHFGNGDADALTDMPLLFDEVDGNPLLPGTSIAGALRNYLREREFGYGKKESGKSPVSLLFGGARGDDEGDQSPLIVFDARGHSAGIELRDGVAIDPETRTAADEKKFDMQLLAAGSTFDLRFELAVSKSSEKMLSALATALTGLEGGEITLGARKRRGFGQVTVRDWHVWKYELQDHRSLLAWLASERDWQTLAPEQPGDTLLEKLGAGVGKTDLRNTAHLSATFRIDGTLMIRSGFGQSDSGPDMVHLHSPRAGQKERVPVIPGTSWAGVLRQRALKIARTISANKPALDKEGKPRTHRVNGEEKPLLQAEVLIDEMFGPASIDRRNRGDTKASRIAIKESVIEDVDSLVVTRVKIDRFTGGAYESALFSEQPAIGKPETRLSLDLSLREPREAELGLVLLLLKDLWTGDLPIGGESGIGRGSLKGMSATLTWKEKRWTFSEKEPGHIQLETDGGAEDPQLFVDALNKTKEWQVSHD
jgi:CRISPR/Cas system CSM-associated protein Csm3 (group 7 of RAMP superfamily)